MPPYYHQADVWLEILDHFGWTKVTQNNIKVCSLIFASSLKKVSIFFLLSIFHSYSLFPYIHRVFSFYWNEILFTFFRYCEFCSFSHFSYFVIFWSIAPSLLITFDSWNGFFVLTPHHPVRRKTALFTAFFHYFDLILSKFEPIPLDIILLSYLFLCFDNRRCGTMWWTVRFFSIRFYVRSALFFVRIPINHIYL